ncbi:acetate/propionate family kinase [Limnoglobus roseus]|uniref:Acetate kinase n=1 Tax=Limnoglobus roseus TaxID=2598579 RepID=A0A5C1AQN0_9BACT|nr:acetate/propionate family kinase [Limnoglobus roseus]QEL20497.1 acetate/propionate family kinase [Limnoglobus roseus]
MDTPHDTPPASTPRGGCVLTINGGSSSIKFALFGPAAGGDRLFAGAVERVGTPEASLRAAGLGDREDRKPIAATDPARAADELIDWLEERGDLAGVAAVGHRVVHGGPDHAEPRVIDAALLADLRRLVPLDPDHLPAELALKDALTRRRPTLPQVACFDTAFHHALPPVARVLPIPRRYGIRRYGFHGLSYAYLVEELRRVAGPTAPDGRLILAHLGSGASLAAVRGGACVDTTMRFTPAGGLVMGTRTGDLDPGVLIHLTRTENLTADQLDAVVNRESGLRGISETSSDMRDLLAREATDSRAADAVALFCYQAKKFIGAMAAALGGVDTLVFAGGVGENSPEVRSRICDGLAFLGVDLGLASNAANAAVISSGITGVTVRVIRTDEEVLIARTTACVLGLPFQQKDATP